MPVITVDGVEVHVRQDARQRRKGITEADRVALREAIATLHKFGVDVRQHAGSCSNQNAIDPLGPYRGVAGCECDNIVQRNRALQRAVHKPWCRVPIGGSECSCDARPKRGVHER